MKWLRVGKLYNIVTRSTVFAYDVGHHTPIGEDKYVGGDPTNYRFVICISQ